MKHPLSTSVRAAALTLTLATCVAAVATPALALDPDPRRAEQPVERVFDQAGVHFTWTDGHLIQVSELSAPEGPVDVVRVHMVDPETGARAGQSFVSITVFRQALDVDNPSNLSAEELALEHIVAGIQGAFPAGAVTAQRERVRTASGSAPGYTVQVRRGATRATGRAFALSRDGVVVVVYQHNAANEGRLEGHLNAIIDSLGVGSASASEQTP